MFLVNGGISVEIYHSVTIMNIVIIRKRNGGGRNGGRGRGRDRESVREIERGREG